MENELLGAIRQLLQEELKPIKEQLREELKPIKDQLQELQIQTEENTREIKALKLQTIENTQILKALEHKADVNKAEHDKMFFEIAEIKGEVKSLRKDISAVEIVTANNWSDIARLKAVK